jgi:hypothetical protein
MKKKNVTTVEELYAAINDTANEGFNIVLAPGTYVLSATEPGGPPPPLRLFGGRLELQRDMSLIGVKGNSSAVVIDAKSLPDPSFKNLTIGGLSGQNTGAIRIGRGSNSIEWLTIVGKPNSASGIETDLTGTDPQEATHIRVEHVVSSGSRRGLDVRNIGAAMAGRIIVAEIFNNDFSAGLLAGQPSEAIRLVNFFGPDGGKIHAVMSGNRFHDSPTGCFVGNNRTNFGLVEVRSNQDTFEDNEAGCVIVGAIISAGTIGTTKLTTTTFDAHGSDFVNNTGSFPPTGPFPTYRGGIVALGAEVQDPTTASDNTALIVLQNCRVSGNQNQGFEAFGARSTGAIAGTTNNKVTISLKNVSTNVVRTEAGTNTVKVMLVR